MTNRYNELSKGNQAIIDAFINSVASGGRDITDIDDDLIQRPFFFNEDDIMTIEAALKLKADFHTHNRKDTVDDAIVAYCNSVLMRLEMQRGEG